MIYIIGGVAKSGKTYISKRLLNEKQISSFSTDYLMMALGKSIQHLDIDVDADDFVVAKKLEPFLKPMIEAMIHNKIDYVIEGVHLLPSFIHQLAKKYQNKITTCFLGYAEIDVQYKLDELNHYQETMENCWYRHYTDAEMITLVEYLIQSSKRIKTGCKEHQLPYFEINNIVKDSDEVINYLLK